MLPTLQKRSEFLRVRGGARFECRAFVLEAKPRPQPSARAEPGLVTRSGPAVETSLPSERSCVAPTWRFGFTVTKRLGNAVVRNRIRRRLREVVRLTAPDLARAAHDYVVIARSEAMTRDFADLRRDLEAGFARVHRSSVAAGRSTAGQRPREKPST